MSRPVRSRPLIAQLPRPARCHPQLLKRSGSFESRSLAHIPTDQGVVHISGVITSSSDIEDMTRAVEPASRVEGVAYVQPDMRLGSSR
jgi:osmotically-inducible protein OsmY